MGPGSDPTLSHILNLALVASGSSRNWETYLDHASEQHASARRTVFPQSFRHLENKLHSTVRSDRGWLTPVTANLLVFCDTRAKQSPVGRPHQCPPPHELA